MFQIQENEKFESQSMSHEQELNLNNSQAVDLLNGPVEGNTGEGNCNGLKKGIDNDAIIADISTMDGLSMYEDIIEDTQKNNGRMKT
jgi:PBP1b-binding outer membrane lipoprotein LpoB